MWFFLFPKKKQTMKEKRFQAIEKMKTKSMEELNNISKSAFQKGFEDLNKRYHTCIIVHGNYFQGDNINIDK